MDANIPASTAISNYLSDYIYTYLDIDDETSLLVLKFNEDKDKPDSEFRNVTSSILSKFLNTTRTTRTGSAHQQAGISVRTFLSSMLVSALYFVVQVLLFTFLRNKLKHLYQAKTVLHPIKNQNDEKLEIRTSGNKNVVQEFFKNTFGWVTMVIFCPIDKYRDLAGLDAYFFQRFLYMLIFLFFSFSVINLPILIPIHYLSGFIDLQGLVDLPRDVQINTPWLDRINMSNIVLKDPNKLIFHLFLSIFVIVWFHIILISELKHVHEISRKIPLSAEYQSILYVENIPESTQGNKIKITDFFNSISPDCLISIRFLPRRCDRLRKYYRELKDLETKLEKLAMEIILEKYFLVANSKLGVNGDKIKRYWKRYQLFCNRVAFILKTPQRYRGYFKQTNWKTILYQSHKPWFQVRLKSKQLYIEERYNFFKLTSQKYQSHLKVWQEKCQALEKWNNEQYLLEHKDCKSQVFLSKAFITFSCPAIAHTFDKLLTSGNIREWNNTLVGTNPHDIIWSNISVSNATIKFMRSALASTLCFLIIIGWVIPVAFIGLVSQIPYVASIIPLLSQVTTKSELVNDIIAGIFPVVTLVFITEFVPFILRWFSYLKCCRTGAEMEIDIQKWFFVFLFIHVFLVVTISSGISLVVERILYNPVSIPTLLAHDLPKSSNFFCSFVLIRGMAYSGGNLIQLKELLFELFYYKITMYNPHKRWKRMRNIPIFQWGSIYPIFSVLGCIGIIYSVIAPLILPLCCIAFALVLFSFKYLFIYQVEEGTPSETFGRLYPQALMQLYAGVYCMEFCMMGLFALSNSYKLCTCMVVAFALTIVAHFKISEMYLSKVHGSPFQTHSQFFDKYDRLEENLNKEFKIPFADGKHNACLWLPQDDAGITGRESAIFTREEITCDLEKCFLSPCGDIILNPQDDCS
ncbi:hypothetical protein ZYGR_0H02710 [Zygosaccharomyces rouxii]|uniref:ZYRO0B10252p n=2 Tax=Zygosaccharomyces rouxii TaxID=4956 RepID=C5DRQ0_ZYGRC|nr:uncharacterized protein ZYRO0B10252g [Zygosaccharomyces rouxii]KAH9200004.1 hypothetical protein LQ764DRAFT_209805 [Zygosaccharomyces rouxii]GAV47429.1 hypothetical protein ZYGR_0H02710 [Zygosaccharomyces rouxii]CAR26461.1 ZYRO0B10252p [Zygosaccharomyces rouxii]